MWVSELHLLQIRSQEWAEESGGPQTCPPSQRLPDRGLGIAASRALFLLWARTQSPYSEPNGKGLSFELIPVRRDSPDDVGTSDGSQPRGCFKESLHAHSQLPRKAPAQGGGTRAQPRRGGGFPGQGRRQGRPRDHMGGGRSRSPGRALPRVEQTAAVERQRLLVLTPSVLPSRFPFPGRPGRAARPASCSQVSARPPEPSAGHHPWGSPPIRTLPKAQSPASQKPLFGLGYRGGLD